MKEPSAATKAAQAEFETASHALWDAEHAADSDPDKVAILRAVRDMADARYMICSHTDKLVEATTAHNEALRTLKAFNPSIP